MQRQLNFVLPRQGVNQLMQLNRQLGLAQRFAALVQHPDIGDHAERIRHRDDAFAQFDPIPRHPGGRVLRLSGP